MTISFVDGECVEIFKTTRDANSSNSCQGEVDLEQI
jgi:hypothetical protein